MFLFSVVFISILASSCSTDSSFPAAVATTPGTIKKLIESAYYNGQVSTIEYNFNYESGNLNAINFGSNFKFEFTMDGNKISQVKTVSNNISSNINTILYEGTNLKSITNASSNEKSEFAHLNGLIATDRNFYGLSNGTWVLSSLKNFTINSASNVESTLYTFYQVSNQASKSSYEYDNKNHPFKNMNPYLRYILSYESFLSFGVNNLTKKFEYPSATATTSTQSHNYVYVYNQSNFPISIKKYGFSNNVLQSECIIEYN